MWAGVPADAVGPYSRPVAASHPNQQPASLGREVLALAVPAFATLLSEPLLVLADSTIIGHWNTLSLAGLGLAANVLSVVVGLCIFLAYGTTSTVARRLGAGDHAGALGAGLDGMALAGIIGTVLAAGIGLGAGHLVGIYGANPAVAHEAARYLSISALGLPAALVTLASTGVLRGLQDTRTPLLVTVGANLANIVLNLTLVWGLHMGIAGSATGTVVSQWCASLLLARVVVRGARRDGVRWTPHPGRVLAAARSGLWLVLRSACLQAGLMLTTRVATGMGTTALAAHQAMNAVWGLLVNALDAIAIAAQAIIGRRLGAGDRGGATHLTWLMVRWGAVGGLVFGVLVWLTHPLWVGLISPDPAVHSLLGRTLLAFALITPVSGVVFVLDGVLIGAGDARYLGLVQVVGLVSYLPMLALVGVLHASLLWLWIAYGGYLGVRCLTLVLRARGEAWQRVGA